MSTDYTFKGWVAHSPDSVQGKMKWEEYQPKPFTERDVDIQITHSGICGSDIHTLRSGWFKSDYPCVVGHEIVGKAVRVGSEVQKGIKVGDIVGVGAQSDSCLRPDCEECSAGEENHCQKGQVQTYNGKYSDGSKSYGGYSNYSRVPAHFVFKIPSAVSPENASSAMCGGVTLYNPLVTNGCGPEKTVGIVGLGGLGHWGVLFAKALGAKKVVVISRTNAKKEDAMKMGADSFIATSEDKQWTKDNAGTLDLIVSTVSSSDMPLDGYLTLLRTHGQFVQVGAPEDKLPALSVFPLLMKGAKIGGSAIGSPQQIEDMLKLMAEKGIQPWIQQRPMQEANQAVIDMNAGKARYRYVLVNENQKL